jgi:DNA repair exonuclease SbcCD ATPase subunit
LKELRAERAKQPLAQAEEGMKDALQKLERAEKADEQMEEALARLAEALDEVEKARKRAEDDLAREELRQVAETVQRLRERQEGAIAEAARIQKEVQQRQEWARVLKSSLGDVRDTQDGLSHEANSVAEKDLTGTPVFAKVLRRSAERMGQAAKRIDALRAKPPELDKLPDAELARLQKEALRPLEQLLEAIKTELDDVEAGGGQGGGQGGGGEGGGGAGPRDPGLPSKAQIKLLRDLEKEVQQRMEAFHKAHPDAARFDDKAKAELKALQKEKREIKELFEELIRPAGEPAGEEGEKKP